MRCEPGIGGRLPEIYDAATGKGLELARITVWEPGRHLAWRSSLDDVTIDVRFRPTAEGTIVRLEATVADAGTDEGGSAVVRVAPHWFATWVSHRDTTPRVLHDLAAPRSRPRPGGTIVQEIETYGYTSYVARDLEGHTWRFAEARPTQPR